MFIFSIFLVWLIFQVLGRLCYYYKKLIRGVLMSETAYQLLAFILYFAAMIAIGFYAYRKIHNLNDYMLGGRSLGPAVSALSAGAADMSQWLLMGLPGAIYVAGLVEWWIAIGLTIGAWLNWKIVAPRLR